MQRDLEELKAESATLGEERRAVQERRAPIKAWREAPEELCVLHAVHVRHYGSDVERATPTSARFPQCEREASISKNGRC